MRDGIRGGKFCRSVWAGVCSCILRFPLQCGLSCAPFPGHRDVGCSFLHGRSKNYGRSTPPMNLALFSEISVRDYYDTVVTQNAERRLFTIPDDELRLQPPQRHVDHLIAANDTGRLVLDPTVNVEVRAETQDHMFIRRWLEYCGPMRLLSLRPRRYHSSPPFVSLLQPPAVGRPGRIVLEQRVTSIPDKRIFDDFCEGEFRKITEYGQWINVDLDYYEQIAREWLLSMVETRLVKLQGKSRGAAVPHVAEQGERSAGSDVAVASAPGHV